MASTAKLIGPSYAFRGDASVYQLTPPLSGLDYVALHTMDNGHLQQVRAFAANESGEVGGFNEIGRLDDSIDHKKLLKQLGYTLR